MADRPVTLVLLAAVCAFHLAAGQLHQRPAGAYQPKGQENNLRLWREHSPEEYAKYVRQYQIGNDIQQCPCLRTRGSNLCISYNHELQAATLEEAMLNFADLTFQNTADSVVSDPWLATSGKRAAPCTSRECQSCTSMMAQHLKQLGAVPNNYTLPWLSPSQQIVYRKWGVCERYGFTRRASPAPRTKMPRRRAPDTELARALQVVREYGAKAWLSSRQPAQSRLYKRQTGGILGERTVLYCVERGNATAGSISVCTQCWSWRRLPDDYFPSFVNEVNCDDADRRCLSGWGSATERLRTLSVLRNVGSSVNPDWRPATIEAAACCDCDVSANSPIESLIVG